MEPIILLCERLHPNEVAIGDTVVLHGRVTALHSADGTEIAVMSPSAEPQDITAIRINLSGCEVLIGVKNAKFVLRMLKEDTR